MPQDLPIFESNNEVLQPQSVASTAQGDDALGSVLGQAGHDLSQTATEINDQQSQSMMYAQTTLAGQAKQDALFKIRANPSPEATAQAMQEYKGAINGIYQGAQVNTADRNTLSRYLSTDYLSVEQKANRSLADQSKLTAQIGFATTFPKQLEDFTNNLFGEPDNAQVNLQGMQAVIGNAMQNKWITPEAGANYYKLLNTQVDRVSALHSMGAAGNVDAQGYHQLTGVPGQLPEQNSPVESSTAHTFNDLQSDYNKHDAISSLYSGNPSSSSMMYAVSKLSPSDFNEYQATMQGVNNAQAALNSGQPYAALQARAQALGSQGTASTVTEDAERNKLQQYLNGFKTDYLGTVAQTPTGQTINQNYNNQVAAIKNTPLSADEMNNQLEQANNDRIAAMVNYGKAKGVPADQIKPIDNQTAAVLQNSFNVNQDPAPALNAAQSLNLTNAAYAAYSLKQANQREALYTTALLKNTDKTGFSQTMIVANQNGQNYSAITYPKGESDKTLSAEVQTRIQPALQYLATQPDAANRTTGLLKASVNAVKYQAYQAGDMSLNHKSDYLDKLSDSVNQAYSLNKGSGYAFNNTQTPMAPADAQALATYASDQAANQLTKGMSDAERQKNLDNNPLFVTISPDNNINVLDHQGNIYWQQPYAQAMLNTAKAQHNTRVAQAQSNVSNDTHPVYQMGLPGGGLG